MKTSDILYPGAVLVMYRRNKDKLDNDDVYFEIASVHNNKVGPAVPLSAKAANTLSILFAKSGRREIGGFIDHRMLYTGTIDGHPCVLWYTEPKKRKMIFSEDLNIPTGYVNLPYLVWYVRKHSLIVFACKEKPTAETRLFRAPFHNTDNNGVVCLGSGWQLISKEFTSFAQLMDNAEAAFFTTQFSHLTGSTPIKGNLNSLYKELVGSDKPFPLDRLIATKKSIYSYINNKEDIQDEQADITDLNVEGPDDQERGT